MHVAARAAAANEIVAAQYTTFAAFTTGAAPVAAPPFATFATRIAATFAAFTARAAAATAALATDVQLYVTRWLRIRQLIRGTDAHGILRRFAQRAFQRFSNKIEDGRLSIASMATTSITFIDGHAGSVAGFGAVVTTRFGAMRLRVTGVAAFTAQAVFAITAQTAIIAVTQAAIVAIARFAFQARQHV